MPRFYPHIFLIIFACWRSLATSPANDNFASRISVTGDYVQVIANNSDATYEPGEPNHPWALGKSIWYTWISPADGWLNVDTTGSSFSPPFAVYTGTSISNLTLVGFSDVKCQRFALDFELVPAIDSHQAIAVKAGTTYQIAFSSGLSPYVYVYNPASPPSGEFTFSLTFTTLRVTAPNDGATVASRQPLTLSAKYDADSSRFTSVQFELDQIVVASFPYTDPARPNQYFVAMRELWAGPHILRARATRTNGVVEWSAPVSFTARPGNDNLADATPLVGMDASALGDIAAATAEPGELRNTRGTGRSVWFYWRAPTNGIARVVLSRNYMPMSVQRRSDDGAMQFVAINYALVPFFSESHFFSFLNFCADSNVEYFFQIDHPFPSSPGPPSGLCDPWRERTQPFTISVHLDQSIRPPDLSVLDGGLWTKWVLQFASPTNTTYSIDTSTNLINWQTYAGAKSSGGNEYVAIPADPGAPETFFRLTVSP